ncbi:MULTISPECIES: preprotein translocase subunit YajC [Anaerococcus]|jgi:preprotein translocase subunit|nr:MULTISPECIES: preprotein translocase subunit YajC [Anaerococcus]MDU2598477.1 preprotein translocase subunit YajC [Anaerococcus sp.]MDU3176298.1 preprotein translocase subunit YajC [Anaerococcus sp.]MDU4025399.1 preprotein translocase subunit YajC [Anaerococcus sp.]MDU5228991.1 preprotein translocase subunit YajC [Anaerococcus sp.]MDU5534925.1 preprotein translocase subunit YajC [Anaerococcus sp.]
MKLEYIILIILLFGFYEKSLKDNKIHRKNREYVNDNLKVGSKITTFSGIIGEVTNIQGEVVTILSGEYDSATKLKIKKSEIENILS